MAELTFAPEDVSSQRHGIDDAVASQSGIVPIAHRSFPHNLFLSDLLEIGPEPQITI